ncbi:hypothetical protein [Streptomyces sp. NPDC058424]
MRTLLVDNDDSFTHNLFHRLAEAGRLQSRGDLVSVQVTAV